MSDAALRLTPLHERHRQLSARLVPFAGYEMPVQYAEGIIAEHNWTRARAGLFDVSHMGQAALAAPDFETAARALEKLVPGDMLSLEPGAMRYSQLTNSEGGIIDDLMVTRPRSPSPECQLSLVLNAACKETDAAWIARHLPPGVRLRLSDDEALLALQGPDAEAVLKRHAPAAASLSFMHAAPMLFDGLAAVISRSGYTGEDGFEISVGSGHAVRVWETLLSHEEVRPIGLGARDTLRLEAGLCLYGHDIDETTSPVEAGLVWSIGKRRRVEGGFIGSVRIMAELKDGPRRRRIGIRPEGRAPAREGTAIVSEAGAEIGRVTSGGFGPTVNAPVAMGYVEAGCSAPENPIRLIVRDRPVPARIVALPFIKTRYKR